jgi:hypothetical protein
MRTAYPPTEETSVAIAVLLAVCALVCGLLGFAFYKLLQPTQMPNPGLAAYKPPPATVMTYPPVAQLRYEQQAVPMSTTDQSSRDTPDETTGRAVQIAEPASVVAPLAREPLKNPEARKGRVRAASTNAQHPASTKLQHTASTKAQYRSENFVPAYPGYAVLH